MSKISEDVVAANNFPEFEYETYSNMMDIQLSPIDARLNFSDTVAIGENGEQFVKPRVQIKVAIPQLKRMRDALDRVIERYEEQFGEIPTFTDEEADLSIPAGVMLH